MHNHELSNAELLVRLDKHVYGHKRAKMALISLLYRARINYYNKNVLNLHGDVKIKPKNLLLIGESGTGKTHLVESLHKVIDFPLLMLDATQLVPSGSSEGVSIKRIEVLIKAKIDEYLKLPGYFSEEGVASQMVVFVDEVDKLAKSFESSGNWNRQIQATLLRLIENKGTYKNLTFIFAGAFSDADFREPEKKNTLGFVKNSVKDEIQHIDLTKELIKYGLITELVGRIPVVVQLDNLSEDDYRCILINKVITAKHKDLGLYGLDPYNFTSEQRESIVKKAKDSGCGVRMLYSEVDRLTEELEFNCEAGGNDVEPEC